MQEKKESNFTQLKTLLTNYSRIPRIIKSKKKILKLRLCNPGISALKGFSAFVCKENEIEYLISYFEQIKSILKTMNSYDRYFCKLVCQDKKPKYISQTLGLTMRGVFIKGEKIFEKFKILKPIRWENL